MPADATGGDNFGNAVSVNGTTALVAAPNKNSTQGAVYVFVRSDTDGTWSQQAKLTLPGWQVAEMALVCWTAVALPEVPSNEAPAPARPNMVAPTAAAMAKRLNI